MVHNALNLLKCFLYLAHPGQKSQLLTSLQNKSYRTFTKSDFNITLNTQLPKYVSPSPYPSLLDVPEAADVSTVRMCLAPGHLHSHTWTEHLRLRGSLSLCLSVCLFLPLWCSGLSTRSLSLSFGSSQPGLRCHTASLLPPSISQGTPLACLGLGEGQRRSLLMDDVSKNVWARLKATTYNHPLTDHPLCQKAAHNPVMIFFFEIFILY